MTKTGYRRAGSPRIGRPTSRAAPEGVGVPPQRDRGSATVWALAALTCLCVVCGAFLAMGQAMVTRHRAAGAADLAALAAADHAGAGRQPACASAAEVARAQGARLLRCEVQGEVSDVTAASGSGFFRAEARARAGPAGPAGAPTDHWEAPSTDPGRIRSDWEASTRTRTEGEAPTGSEACTERGIHEQGGMHKSTHGRRGLQPARTQSTPQAERNPTDTEASTDTAARAEARPARARSVLNRPRTEALRPRPPHRSARPRSPDRSARRRSPSEPPSLPGPRSPSRPRAPPPHPAAAP